MKKSSLLYTVIVLCGLTAKAQETIEQKSKLTRQVKEIYHVLKSDMNVRSGLYKAVADNGKAVAVGNYTNNKRTGLWHFYAADGTPVENYDYDHNKLLYEADDNITLRPFVYAFDKNLSHEDKVTKPVRIGGRYFGYLTYFNVFKKPEELQNTDNDFINVTVELLVSPGGRLADYNINLESPYYQYSNKLNINLAAIPDNDKLFVPATLNGEPVSSSIIIKCKLDNKDHLDFRYEHL